MPELSCGGRHWTVEVGANLLDALNQAGLRVPYSCRAGSCHACLVRCVDGEPLDQRPAALSAAQRSQGWRLACQCRVTADLCVEPFDPAHEGLSAQVHSADWLDHDVLRLRLLPERPLRYRAGQHVLLWTPTGIARPYSLASLPGEDRWLEFHLDCSRPGAFSTAARRLQPGDRLRLGQLHGGALHYDPDWAERPLLLLASGTGLAPLWSILREALRQQHSGPVRLLHLVRERSYLAGPLLELAGQHAGLEVQWADASQAQQRIRELRVASRQEIALVCGHAEFVAASCKQLFLAGLPRGQVLSDCFLEREVGDGLDGD
ncbi:iron-sulfur-binding ferredoxin reductase [Stutzerimonas stutzeri]|uniref:iron-sulfur-binding ferredoxin reductase n=1 Tax=Stutzerimonas sp. S1 TaxID=3030652 RepID=UPI002223F761|nr:iron-sulfur-binding ferredoxin reductase [Stutzerimonas sp. S1]MCW3149937.1 iron-sulfur-binding ferredoxin reductase [Stutzerimonas sp. S1]